MTRECVEHLFKPFYIAELRNGDLYMVVYNEHDGWLLINPDLDTPPVYDPLNPLIVYLKIAQDETKYFEALDAYMDYIIECTAEEQDNDEF